MNEHHRFADTGAALYELATHFAVHCPQCQGRALVNRDGRLTCPACFRTETPGRWYGAASAYASVKCRECRAPLQRSAPWNGRWKKIDLQCEACGDTCQYDAHITYHPFHDGQKTDPVYGLPLWLQKEFRGNLFWAYNHEHLALLRDYIGARLRERGIEPRNSIRNNSSMISRLPEFMKKAAHREDLLKLIESLQNK